MRKLTGRTILIFALVTVASLAVSTVASSARGLPHRIALPDGSQPEGLAISNGPLLHRVARRRHDLGR